MEPGNGQEKLSSVKPKSNNKIPKNHVSLTNHVHSSSSDDGKENIHRDNFGSQTTCTRINNEDENNYRTSFRRKITSSVSAMGTFEEINQSGNNNIRIPGCTFQWTKEILNSLHITTTLSTAYKPMDIICGVINITDEMDEAAETLKCCISNNMPDGLRNLDFNCVSEITSEHESRLTSDNCSLFSCWQFKKRRKLDYYQRLLYESLDKMNPRFSSSGETFGRLLMYLSTLCRKEEAITECMYLQLFKNFLEMFGLFCYTAPALPKKTMKINGVDVLSNADLLLLHEENLEIIAVCKMERSQTEREREEKIKTEKEAEQKIEREREELILKEEERTRKEKCEHNKKEMLNSSQTETKKVQMNKEIKKSLEKDFAVKHEKEVEKTCVSPPSKRRCFPKSAVDTCQSAKYISHNLTSQNGRVSTLDTSQSVQQHSNHRIGPQTGAEAASDICQLVQCLGDNLIGQIGGELLLHYQLSAFKGGVLGLIVQNTHVTFTHLITSSKEEIDAISEGKDICAPVSVVYSKPYNYLKAKDRMEIIKPLLILRSVYLGEAFI